MIEPRYPIYIPSKGRAEHCLTAKFLKKDGVPFYLVVEPEERDIYAKIHGTKRLLVLDFPFKGADWQLPAVRNFIKKHAESTGVYRHWQLDDNIREVRRLYKGQRIVCNSRKAFSAIEDFVDRYENVGMAGMNYMMFVVPSGPKGLPPFYLNCHVYSNMLMVTDLPLDWRGPANEDVDMCLQVLSSDLCIVSFNAFMVHKIPTMKMKGGMDEVYDQQDGRLRISRGLEKRWPGVVTVKRRFGRPHHVIKDSWKKFDTPLIRRKDIDWDALKSKSNEYGMKVRKMKPIRSKNIKRILRESKADE